MAPSRGEDLGATGFLGGEKPNYLTEDGVGEIADAVDATAATSIRRRRRFHAVGCRCEIGRLRGFRRPWRGLTGCEVLGSPPLGTGTQRLHLRGWRPGACGDAAPPHRHKGSGFGLWCVAAWDENGRYSRPNSFRLVWMSSNSPQSTCVGVD